MLTENSPLGDRRNMVYMGTVTAAGKASAIVVATGMSTELGHIAGLLQRSQPEQTPLQRRLAELGKVLVVRLPGYRRRSSSRCNWLGAASCWRHC